MFRERADQALGLMAELMSSGETFDTIEAGVEANVDVESSVFSYSRFNNTWDGAKEFGFEHEVKSEA